MGIKSNNLAAAYHDFFSRSGKDAVGDYKNSWEQNPTAGSKQ